jgi:hypothetical protein
MPLGVLKDEKLEHVPGTAPLSDQDKNDTEYAGIDPSLLKHDSTGKIVLVPQPSDSTNDPYNWPKMKKILFAIAFVYGCGCVGGKKLHRSVSFSYLTDTSLKQSGRYSGPLLFPCRKN